MSRHHALTDTHLLPRQAQGAEGAQGQAEDDDWETADLSTIAPLKALSLRAEAPTFQPTPKSGASGPVPSSTRPSTISSPAPKAAVVESAATAPKPAPIGGIPTLAPAVGGPKTSSTPTPADDWDDDAWDVPRRNAGSGAGARQLWDAGSARNAHGSAEPSSSSTHDLTFPPLSSAPSLGMPPTPASASSFSLGPPTSYAPQIKILRRDRPGSASPGGGVGAAGGGTGAPGGQGRKDMTLQEREAAYKAARERIFGAEGQAAEGARAASVGGGQRSGASSGSVSPAPALGQGQGQAQKREKSGQGFVRSSGGGSGRGHDRPGGGAAGAGLAAAQAAEKKVEGVLRMPRGPAEGGGFRPAQ